MSLTGLNGCTAENGKLERCRTKGEASCDLTTFHARRSPAGPLLGIEQVSLQSCRVSPLVMMELGAEALAIVVRH